MIKSIEFPNREFATRKELFKALKENKELIIDFKKAIKNSLPIKSVYLNEGSEAIKGLEIKEGHSVHVINTTGVLDGHNDLHVKGIWSKSVNEQQNKVLFLADHDMSISSVIAHPKDVMMSVKDMSWNDLGFKFKGSTDALVFEVKTENIRHKAALYIIENKVDIQHSIRMSYVKVELAINSNEDEFKTELKAWNKYLPDVVNSEEAEKQGFMWVIKEAKIEKEGSMVLLGSNSATPMLNNKAAVVIEEKNKIDNPSRLYPFI